MAKKYRQASGAPPPSDMHARWVAGTAAIAAKKEKKRKAGEHMEKWALVAQARLKARQRVKARAAFKKAEFWERKLKKLEE